MRGLRRDLRLFVIPVSEIADRLRARAEDVARHLLPDGRRAGAEWYASSSHSPLGYAVSVVISGRKKGVVLFTGSTSRGRTGGDVLTLAEEIKGSRREAVEWAKSFLGLSDDYQESEQARQRREQQSARREREASRKEVARAQHALEIWARARPLAGTLGEVYLRRRGIERADWPPTVRFCDALEWRDQETGEVRLFPTLVAACQSVDRKVKAIWRIYLGENGDKAPVTPNKVGLGPASGCAVRLGPAASEIGVGEGLESTFGVEKLVAGAFPLWATLSTSGMINVQFPDIVRVVRIFPDGDFPGRDRNGNETRPPGLRAAERLAERVRREGRTAIIEPEPDFKTDFMDIAKGTQ